MSRLKLVNHESATGEAKELLDAVKQKMGMVPNLIRAMATSPATLKSFLGFGALDTGKIDAKLREQINLTVSERNGCNYCLAAHTAIGNSIGLSSDQIVDSRRAKSVNTKDDAALKFTASVVDKRGRVSDDDIAAVREVGFTDGEIIEIVANVAKMTLTNYVNHLVETDIDFPLAPELEHATAHCSTSC